MESMHEATPTPSNSTGYMYFFIDKMIDIIRHKDHTNNYANFMRKEVQSIIAEHRKTFSGAIIYKFVNSQRYLAAMEKTMISMTISKLRNLSDYAIKCLNQKNAVILKAQYIHIKYENLKLKLHNIPSMDIFFESNITEFIQNNKKRSKELIFDPEEADVQAAQFLIKCITPLMTTATYVSVELNRVIEDMKKNRLSYERLQTKLQNKTDGILAGIRKNLLYICDKLHTNKRLCKIKNRNTMLHISRLSLEEELHLYRHNLQQFIYELWSELNPMECVFHLERLENMLIFLNFIRHKITEITGHQLLLRREYYSKPPEDTLVEDIIDSLSDITDIDSETG